MAVTPFLTKAQQPLLLYSRQGCCLCEGLEQRLRRLDLSAIAPPLVLEVIDIDAPGTDPALKARYDLEVPVLALASMPLPRVSPRLDGDGLYAWLQRACSSALGSD
nr:glutaredoxin family protein [Synechococcus sp. UW140]